jgi:endonuclease/exonuclease/phosphatase family metal-dependent hydrolase
MKHNNLYKLTITYGLLLLLMAVLVSYSFTTKRASDQNQKTIKVLSYNIHYGIGMDKKYDLERIAKVIVSHNPDIVGLQEIGDSTMAAELGRLTEMNFVFGQSLGKANGYGDAVLSKHPFKWVANYSIPSASEST